jgi:hypothetical protein
MGGQGMELKWVELFGQFVALDRKVCFAAFIVSQTTKVLNNILKDDCQVDYNSEPYLLGIEIRQKLEEYVFLDCSNENPIISQFWLYLQGCAHTNTYDQLEIINYPLERAMDLGSAEDFTLNSYNYTFFKECESL